MAGGGAIPEGRFQEGADQTTFPMWSRDGRKAIGLPAHRAKKKTFTYNYLKLKEKKNGPASLGIGAETGQMSSSPSQSGGPGQITGFPLPGLRSRPSFARRSGLLLDGRSGCFGGIGSRERRLENSARPRMKLLCWIALCVPLPDFCGADFHLESFQAPSCLLQQSGVVFQALGHVRVVGPQGLLQDRQRALVEGLGLGILALGLVE